VISKIDHFGFVSIVSYQDCIYLFGGLHKICIQNELYQKSDTVGKYDPITDQYSEITFMKTSRFGHQVVSVYDKFYIIGGSSSSSGDHTLNSMEMYDPTNGNWYEMSSMLIARSCFGCCVVRNRIYVCGGYTSHYIRGQCNKIYTNTVECYDPSTNTWSTFEPLISQRAECNATVLHDTIYIFGGRNEKGKYMKSGECFHLTTSKKWTKIGKMNWKIAAPAVVGLHLPGERANSELRILTPSINIDCK
jgi:N-acetylneuraminic acid mutarotase